MSEIVIDKFDEFIEKCVIGKEAILTKPLSYNKDEKLFWKGNLEMVQAFLKEVKALYERKKNEENGNTKEKTWGIGDIFSGFVFQDLRKEHSTNQEDIIKVLLHCNWLMYLCSERQHKQGDNKYYKEDKTIKTYFETKTYWSIGQAFSGTSLDAMLFIVELLLKLDDFKKDKKIINKEILKKEIIKLCEDSTWKGDLKWNEKDDKPISSNSISNVLLFLCKPGYYLPIPAQSKKELISEKLKDLEKDVNLTQDEGEDLKSISSIIDQSLFKIRKQIRTIYTDFAQKETDKNKKEYFSRIAGLLNPFWQPTIRPFWDKSTSDLKNNELSPEALLEYKKAMVLYGPPGTSKSYQARRMAENLIAKALRVEKKNNIEACIKDLTKTCDLHIHILQMHPNYTYDDFIIGKSIDVEKGGSKVVVKPGKLLKIISAIQDDDKIPHFVILDEINRVDISRVFGELFTAMEPSYRDEGVELSVDIKDITEEDKKPIGKLIKGDKLFLIVPKKMYFIGTMNMIDFSLEQVDFALRRRFVWLPSTYDENRLEEIISEKIAKQIIVLDDKKAGKKQKKEIKEIKEIEKSIKDWNDFPDDFSMCCSTLNNLIKMENGLGKDYVIGHAFFTEIVDIFETTQNWNIAKNILWKISISPTLEAYCGTMDEGSKNRFIDNCENAFLSESTNEK